MPGDQNSKHETRNSKQIPMTQVSMSQTAPANTPFGISSFRAFVLVSDFEFDATILGSSYRSASRRPSFQGISPYGLPRRSLSKTP